MNFFKINNTPTILFVYELSLAEDSPPCYKDHVLTRSVEQISKRLIWIADKNTSLALRFNVTAQNSGKLYDPSILRVGKMSPLKLYVGFVSTLGVMKRTPHVLTHLFWTRTRLGTLGIPRVTLGVMCPDVNPKYWLVHYKRNVKSVTPTTIPQ